MVSLNFFYPNSFSRFLDISKKRRKKPLVSCAITILGHTLYGKVKSTEITKKKNQKNIFLIRIYLNPIFDNSSKILFFNVEFYKFFEKIQGVRSKENPKMQKKH